MSDIRNIYYDDKNKCFSIADSDGFTTSICTKLDFESAYTEDESDYIIYYLYNNRDDCTENSIYEVFTKYENKNKRIGWIFPAQALNSSFHDYADNKHFLIYAYVATRSLIESLFDPTESYNFPDEYSDFITINDVIECMFHDKSEYVNFLVINKARVKDHSFNIENYIPSLYGSGYTFSGEGNFNALETEGLNKKIHLRPISDYVENKAYIVSLFKYQIPSMTDEISKFLMYYQVIEYFIQVIFDIEFKQIIDDARLSEKKLDSNEIKEKINGISSEQTRINKLFSQYTELKTNNFSSVQNSIDSICRNFLEKHERKTKNSWEKNLYSVRCYIVHSLYKSDVESIQMIRELNDPFSELVIGIIVGFINPH